jgi:hypothetical protein
MLAVCAVAQEKPTPAASAVLVKELHVKRVNVGDTVFARTTSRIVLNDGKVINEGTRLVGRVTAVNVKPGSGAPSQLGLLFDRIQLQKNEDIPISAALVSVGPPDPSKGVSTLAGNTGMNSFGRIGAMAGDGGAFSGNQPKGGLANGKSDELQPGVSLLSDITLGKQLSTAPGTTLESTKSQIFLASGTRLLFRVN